MVEILTEKIQKRNFYGQGLLHSAVIKLSKANEVEKQEKFLKMIRSTVKAGFSMHALDKSNKIPIEYLIEGVSDEIFYKVLEIHVQAGFDICAKKFDYPASSKSENNPTFNVLQGLLKVSKENLSLLEMLSTTTRV